MWLGKTQHRDETGCIATAERVRESEMNEEVEISKLDVRYERYRMKSLTAERILLNSIAEKGIRDALLGVDTNGKRVLLDGFKRYRCAGRLHIGIVPYRSLGSDEACAILKLLRIANSRTLSILEQAALIDELMKVHMMSNAEISRSLEKSKSWVSMRTGIIREMSECVRDQLFRGRFPVYSYMYTLRQFIRMNSATPKGVDEFVQATAGKQLSIRAIEFLAHGFFKGSEEFRQQITSGNISWALGRLKPTSTHTGGCTEFERAMLRDLELTQKYMQRLIHRSTDQRLKSNTFYSQANILAGGIIRQLERFAQSMGEFYDRSRQA